METIMAVCRTLANRSRLRLLQTIYAHPRVTVNALAAATGQPLYRVSHQLKLLSNYHLIQKAPSGRRVFCQPVPPRQISNPFLRALQALLCPLLASDAVKGPLRSLQLAPPAPSWECVFRALVQTFTTYTHLRRLLILREIAKRGLCSATDIQEAVGMSPQAAERQLEKLCRRHMLVAHAGTPTRWSLALAPSSEFNRKLWDLVRRELQIHQNRTARIP